MAAGKPLRRQLTIEYSNDIHSKVSAKAEVVPCVIGSVWRKSNLNFEIRGNVRQSMPGKPKPVLMQSKVFADMMFARMIESAAEWLAKSIVYADATAKKSTATSAQSSSKSTESVDIVQQPELPTSGHSKSYSEASVGIVKKEPLPTKGESVSISASFAEIGQLQALDAESSVNARSGSDIRIDKSTPLPTAGKVLTQSITSANIDVTEPIPTGCCFDSTSKNVILMHDAKSRPTWAEHKAISQMNASSYKARPLGTNAACKTGSIVQCALGTGWLPPVMVNGGLFVRQSGEVIPYDNGELEVR